MSQEDRIEFIRNNGDPKISIGITIKSAEGDPATPSQRSPLAENLLKERVQSFGFRIWNDDAAAANKTAAADFGVTGEAKFKKLSAKLEASGITIEKFVLTSWTVKCTDRKTGEEIYHNTQIPEKASWASEDLALRDVGKLVGDEFSKSFFLQHFHFTGQKVALNVPGLQDKNTAQQLLNEFTGMRSVLAARLDSSGGNGARFALDLSGGTANPSELVQHGLLGPLNQKLGRSCFSVSGSNANEVSVALDAGCNTPTVLGRLDSLPPAALFDAPQPRREAVVKNPEVLRKLSI
jgi:serine/threonine-protein kinase